MDEMAKEGLEKAQRLNPVYVYLRKLAEHLRNGRKNADTVAGILRGESADEGILRSFDEHVREVEEAINQFFSDNYEPARDVLRELIRAYEEELEERKSMQAQNPDTPKKNMDAIKEVDAQLQHTKEVLARLEGFD